jgi:hypothetical protein
MIYAMEGEGRKDRYRRMRRGGKKRSSVEKTHRRGCSIIERKLLREERDVKVQQKNMVVGREFVYLLFYLMKKGRRTLFFFFGFR